MTQPPVDGSSGRDTTTQPEHVEPAPSPQNRLLAVLGIFLYFGLAQVFDQPDRAFEAFAPFFPKGFGGVLVAMGLTFIAFEGYDLIATVAEEIKEPEKNIPRGLPAVSGAID